MSDAIREAFEAWWASETDSGFPPTKMGDKYESALADYAWVGWKAALKSQTAPAVPEGWMLFPVEAWDFLTGVGTLSGCHFGDSVADDKTGRPRPFWWRSHIRHMLSAAPQIDHSPEAGKVVQGNPRALWDFANEVAQGKWNQYNRSHVAGIRAAAQFMDKHPPTPAADGGEVEPVAWAVFADNGNIRIWGREKPKSFPDAVPLYLGPAVKDSLTVESQVRLDSEDQKGMERIVEAVAHIGIDFGYGTYELEQCHIDRAREIKESMARLRSNGGGNDE